MLIKDVPLFTKFRYADKEGKPYGPAYSRVEATDGLRDLLHHQRLVLTTEEGTDILGFKNEFVEVVCM